MRVFLRSIDNPTRPPIDEIFTIQPRSPLGRASCFNICAMAYFIPRNGPRILTACDQVVMPGSTLDWRGKAMTKLTIVLSNASTGSSAIRFCPQNMPALLTMLHSESAGVRVKTALFHHPRTCLAFPIRPLQPQLTPAHPPVSWHRPSGRCSFRILQ